jgi:hypothetical protein
VSQIFLQPGSPGNEGPEELLEEWEMVFTGTPPSQQPRDSAVDAPAEIYKRMCVMARTIYSFARVLPSYGLYRSCCEQRATTFNMTYRILSSLPSRTSSAESTRHGSTSGSTAPWAARKLERFAFAPIDTQTGSLRIAVQYAAGAAASLHAPLRPVSIPQHLVTNYIQPDGAMPYARHTPKLDNALGSAEAGALCICADGHAGWQPLCCCSVCGWGSSVSACALTSGVHPSAFAHQYIQPDGAILLPTNIEATREV